MTPEKPSVKPEVAELIDGASLLSENEWVEVAKYQRELDEEKIRKERDQRNQQKLFIKNTLEQQLQEKKNIQDRQREEKRLFEEQLMKNLKQKEDYEAKYKHEMNNRAQ